MVDYQFDAYSARLTSPFSLSRLVAHVKAKINVSGGRTLRKFCDGVVNLQGVEINLPPQSNIS
ncbi:hypothetical protein CASFOL_042898 [Castilleja foliolosa]|uniref:Uncharacterized protein n=1 Tax=Castilleja foliolosa TaxID=1961234 RepID=A0ABD3B7G4_9LAMI